MPEGVHYLKENYPKVSIEILDGNYDEIREWIIHGQVDCGFLSSIVADDLKFYPLRDDPLCAVFPEGHPLAAQPSGEPDAAGISEIHPAAKGYTADKIRTNRGERYKSRSPFC